MPHTATQWNTLIFASTKYKRKPSCPILFSEIEDSAYVCVPVTPLCVCVHCDVYLWHWYLLAQGLHMDCRQDAATQWNTLQHTATHCNTLHAGMLIAGKLGESDRHTHTRQFNVCVYVTVWLASACAYMYTHTHTHSSRPHRSLLEKNSLSSCVCRYLRVRRCVCVCVRASARASVRERQT